MPHAELVQTIRQQVRSMFEQLGADLADSYREAILLMEQCYCGRRFYCRNFSAVWFAEENEVKFYDEQGAVIQVAQLGQASREKPQLRAA